MPGEVVGTLSRTHDSSKLLNCTFKNVTVYTFENSQMKQECGMIVCTFALFVCLVDSNPSSTYMHVNYIRQNKRFLYLDKSRPGQTDLERKRT